MDQTWNALARLHARAKTKLEKALEARHRLSASEYAVLQCLQEAPGGALRMQEMAEAVCLSQSAASRLVGRLEERPEALLERSACEMDGRGVYTRITEEGERHLKRARETCRDVMDEVWAEREVQSDLATLFDEARRAATPAD